MKYHKIELRHLRYFQAVAEHLNFRQAAKSLYITQPGLSRQIKQLELSLELRLFRRTRQRVVLTEAGQFLYTKVDLLLQDLETTFRSAAMIAKGERGQVKIGFVGSAMQTIIPELLKKVADKFPYLQTNLQEMANEDQVNALLRNEIDVGFVRYERVSNALQQVVLLRESFSLVLPKSHHLNQDNFRSVRQLRSESFIFFGRSYSKDYYDNIMSIFTDQGFTPEVSHRSVHAITIFRLVERGLGVAIVPTSLTSGFNLGVRFIELANLHQKTSLSIVWSSENPNPALHSFLTFLPVKA